MSGGPQSRDRPSVYAVHGGVLSLSGPALGDFLSAVVARGVPFRFVARGSSMHPFIRDGDTITVGPLSASRGDRRRPRAGEVVAFVYGAPGRLVVHRAVAREDGRLLIRGNNCPGPDGLFDPASVLGVVTRVERGAHRVRLGLGPERAVIAGLARRGALVPLVASIRRTTRPVVLRLRALRQRWSA